LGPHLEVVQVNSLLGVILHPDKNVAQKSTLANCFNLGNKNKNNKDTVTIERTTVQTKAYFPPNLNDKKSNKTSNKIKYLSMFIKSVDM
jgi:hypothetical protein